ncbi:hypothetical protein NEMBOFW57_004721 [Staphylotrichum longicolle]|uniref:Uncharacterized protein n=1 Tax=Staphylotrichum longicolle TaxID=669026 RepID=A0AAD4F7N8_9PEZI|nr:hypothetical protein NEMBOFW57_004721 [Staphylotrichum longicolle]
MAEQEQQAKSVLSSMKHASETVRGAIAAAIPVANNQVLTVSLPGTIIDWKEYYYNVSRHIKPPLDVQVKEARLVDGMIPLSKYTAGKTGKSVARSYLAALDLLVPVEASVSGVVSNETTEVTDERLKTIRDRYKYSMSYLTSPDDTPSGAGRTKVDTYVLKQSAWAREVAAYQHAQAQALERLAPAPGSTTAQMKAAQEKYMQWLQEHARDYKNNIQTKYMDWVVHGYKFMVDFHFGVVDISSGMKRIENSKEAYRNLTIIASDGSSEYNGVVLTPASWATIVAKKALNWKKNNGKPNPAEIRAEIRRLQSLLASHETLQDAIEKDAFVPVLSQDNAADDSEVRKAYAQVYSDMDTKNAADRNQPQASKEAWLQRFGVTTPTDNALKLLADAQKVQTEASLSRNNRTVRESSDQNKARAGIWIAARIKQINADIEDLKKQLTSAQAHAAPSAPPLLPVVNSEGMVASGDELVANPSIKNPPVASVIDLDNEDSWRNAVDDGPDPWTKSASAVCAKAGWGWWSASASASHTESSAEAMQSMSKLEVEVSMSCMVVEIERPWLHAELFVDAELDSGAFKISPGEEALKKAFENEQSLDGAYQQFSSYPSAFVVAADIELSVSIPTVLS